MIFGLCTLLVAVVAWSSPARWAGLMLLVSWCVANFIVMPRFYEHGLIIYPAMDAAGGIACLMAFFRRRSPWLASLCTSFGLMLVMHVIFATKLHDYANVVTYTVLLDTLFASQLVAVISPGVGAYVVALLHRLRRIGGLHPRAGRVAWLQSEGS